MEAKRARQDALNQSSHAPSLLRRGLYALSVLSLILCVAFFCWPRIPQGASVSEGYGTVAGIGTLLNVVGLWNTLIHSAAYRSGDNVRGSS